MMRFILIWWVLVPVIAVSQGRNHNWLIGYDIGLFDTNVTSTKATLQFDTTNVSVIPGNFKMPFRAAQGNISDENGNLLMVSNGCWIANATGDTMLNGGGLNPSPFTTSWCDNTTGIPFQHSNIILPYPGDTTKYILFHQTGTDNVNFKASFLYYSVIDMTLDNGLGGVIAGQKNLIALQDGLNPNLAVCKHANGRDWWITAFKDSSDTIYKILLTPSGITSITQQSFGFPPMVYLMGQVQFSPDGKKMAYHYYDGTAGSVNHYVRLFDFDRCTGLLSNPDSINFNEPYGGLGLAFSTNSKYLYFSTFLKVFQVNMDTSNVQASLQVVAVNDTFYSPYFPFQTNFWLMYLAANGKIYICSGNGVIDMHYINYPDSGGIACDVQQHALHLPCYYVRGNVYHPNYYLGCDTALGCPCLNNVGIKENQEHDFKFSISPNPTNGSIKIIYMLPQNKNGEFDVFDVNGKNVFSSDLPQWSTLQNFSLAKLSDGIYNCLITSDTFRVTKKIVVIH